MRLAFLLYYANVITQPLKASTSDDQQVLYSKIILLCNTSQYLKLLYLTPQQGVLAS